MYQYVLWGDVQDQLYALAEAGRDEISFYDAFLAIETTKVKKSDTFPMPDFYTWDCLDADGFFDLVRSFPVLLDTMLIPAVKSRKKGRQTLKTYSTTDFSCLFQARRETAFSESDAFSFRFILKGSAEVFYSRQQFTLTTGDLVVFPPHQPHRFIGGDDCVAITISVWKQKFEAIFNKALGHTHILKNFFLDTLTSRKEQFLLFHFTDQNHFPLIRELFAETCLPSEYAYDICTNILEILILKALNYYHFDRIAQKDIRENDALMIPAALQYIHDQHKQLSLETLAEKFHYNPEYLSKKLKAETGKSFQQLLTEERIFIAIQLITSTNLAMEEIGTQVGYRSPVTFSRAFKNLIGISPGQYRKEYTVY